MMKVLVTGSRGWKCARSRPGFRLAFLPRQVPGSRRCPRSKNLSRFIHENYLRGGHHKAALWNRPVPQGIVGRNLHEPVMSGLNLKAPTLAERWVADLEVIMFEVQVADLP